MNRSRQIFSGVAVILIIIGVIIGVIISPLALQLIAGKKLNWPLLSNVGQSYGAASAMLSALAFFGVALALVLQVRQARESRNYSIRELHSSLLRMGIADKRYLEAWGNLALPPNMDRDVFIYMNLIMNYLDTLYKARAARPEEIRYHIREIFDGAIGRAYWHTNRDAWLTLSQGTTRKLARIIEEEYRLAESSGPPKRPIPSTPMRQNSSGKAKAVGRLLRIIQNLSANQR